VSSYIEDQQGRRIRNLMSYTRLPAGPNMVTWDGYNEGERDCDGNIVRQRAAAGQYRVRGLVHDGLKLKYEFSVYSPGTPAWFTLDNTGAWLCDHTPPADILFLSSPRTFFSPCEMPIQPNLRR
jgi:hypothetical protein